MGNEDVLEKIQSAGLGAVTEPMGLQVLHTIIENPHDFPPVFMVTPFVEQQKKKTSKQNKWFTYSTDERMTMIEIAVRNIVEKVTGIDSIQNTDPLMDSGVDSLSSVELRNHIQSNLMFQSTAHCCLIILQ